MSLAILYVNSKHRDGFYAKEANLSAKSFKRFLPHAKFYLYTDFIDKNKELTAFDEIRKCNFYVPVHLSSRVHLNGQMIAKHQSMLELKEENVLYLGADTYALKNEVENIEKILEKFDLAVTHAPVRINTELNNSPIPMVPTCFPEMNCDLILYRNNDKLRSWIKNWQKAYLEDMFSHPHDQGTFRYLAYHSDLRIAILPPEYNYRGKEYRRDTIILQNRFTLYDYLEEKSDIFNVKKIWSLIKNFLIREKTSMKQS